MSDKPVAMLVAGVIAAPICLLCFFGPALFAWAVVWVSGIVSGLGAVATTGLAMIAAILVYGLVRRRRATRDAAATPLESRAVANQP